MGDAGTEPAQDPFAIRLPPRPYPGLRPFDAAEWPIFFGRERMIDAVVTRLVTDRFIVVHGDSGSGKSSLVRAGVLPRLLQDQARGGARWRTCTALPRGGPLRNLAQALAALDGRADDAQRVLDLRRALNLGRHAPAALAEAMLSGPDDHLCLLIDQFEELFEHARQPGGESEARGLTDALVAWAEAPPPGLYLALTMRSEYLGHCARFPGLAEAVNQRQYLLPPMVTADLLRAIREPAVLYGGEVDPALAERLAADALGIDGLPLVQHALMLMQRQLAAPDPATGAAPDSWRLTPADYPEGGLGALLSRHADSVMQGAEPAGRPRLVEDMMRALTSVNAEGHAVRRPLPLSQLAAVCAVPTDALRPVLDAFRADGVSLMTPGLAPGETPALADVAWIDIGHEALIRSWRRLANPQDGWLVNEFRNGLVWRSLLVQAESFERDRRSVLSAVVTEERSRWLGRRNPAWAERYGGGWDRVLALMTESRSRADEALQQAQEALATRARADQSRERMLRAVGVAIGALCLAGWAGWQTLQARDAQLAATQARDKANEERDVAQSDRAQLQTAQDKTRQVLDSVKRVVELASRNPGTPPKVLAELNTQVRGLGWEVAGAEPTPADLPTGAYGKVVPATPGPAAGENLATRVYVHIGTPDQRGAAETFRKLLGQQKPGGPPLLVPGVQLVTGQRNEGVLRCFRPSECRDEAPQLLAAANTWLAAPVLKLQDLSARYTDYPPRPHHFEVWFGSGALSLSAAALQAASAAQQAKP